MLHKQPGWEPCSGAAAEAVCGYQRLPLGQTPCFIRANGKKGGGEKKNGKKASTAADVLVP